MIKIKQFIIESYNKIFYNNYSNNESQIIDYNKITKEELLDLLNIKLRKNNCIKYPFNGSIKNIQNIEINIEKIINLIQIFEKYTNGYTIEYYNHIRGYFTINFTNVLDIIYLNNYFNLKIYLKYENDNGKHNFKLGGLDIFSYDFSNYLTTEMRDVTLKKYVTMSMIL